MRTLKARKIAQVKPAELYGRIVSQKGQLLPVEFDDGIVNLEATRIIASSYFWGFIRKFPTFPLSKEYIIKGHFKANKPSDMFNRIIWDLSDHLRATGQPHDIFDTGITAMVMDFNNDLYNDICNNTSEFYRSVDILDFINCAYSEDMLALRCYRVDRIKEDPKCDQKVVTEILDKAAELMLDGVNNPDGSLNVLSWLIQLGVIKNDQTLQSVLMRGWLVDIDGERIEHPISNNLMEGMNTVEDSAVQAREGAGAIVNNKQDLGRITHKGRAMTVNTIYKTHITMGDCGSPHTASYKVIEDEIDSNVGCYYVDDNGQIQQFTRERAVHMIGKTIKRRSPLGCVLEDQHSVCETCLGGVADGIRKDIGVGIGISKLFSQVVIQRTMSTKHFQKSIAKKVKGLPLNAEGFLVTTGNNIYIHQKQRKTKRLKLHVAKSEFRGYLDVMNVDNVGCLTLNNISAIEEVNIIAKSGSVIKQEAIQLSDGKDKVRISYDILEYVKKHPERVEETERGSYIIDLELFTRASPLFTLSTRQEGLLAFYTDIIKKFSRAEKVTGRSTSTEFNYPVYTAYVIYKKLLGANPISLNMVELLLASFVVKDMKDGGNPYVKHLGCALDGNCSHANANTIIDANSLAVKLINQAQAATLSTFEHYLNDDRMDSSLDCLVDPVGVLEYEAGNNIR